MLIRNLFYLLIAFVVFSSLDSHAESKSSPITKKLIKHPVETQNQVIFLQNDIDDIGPDLKKISLAAEELMTKNGFKFDLHAQVAIPKSKNFRPRLNTNKVVTEKLNVVKFLPDEVSTIDTYYLLTLKWTEPKLENVYYTANLRFVSKNPIIPSRTIFEKKLSLPMSQLPSSGMNQFPHQAMAQKVYFETLESLSGEWK